MTHDIKWDGQDVVIDETGDLDSVEGTSLLEQRLAILVRDEIRNIVGETITASTLANAESSINQAIVRDTRVSGIRRLSVTEIDKRNNTVTIKAQTSMNDSFESEIEL